MASRRKGKGIMVPDAAPSELPEDIPSGCKYKLSWRESKDKKCVLLEIFFQGRNGYCWTVVLNRMISAHLYIHQKVRKLLRLSCKHLFASIEEKFDDGFLKNYKGVKVFLKENGLVLEEECKCVLGKKEINTVACDKVKDKTTFKIRELIIVEGNEVDEKQIIKLLNTHGVIAVHITVDEKYKTSKKDEIFYGTTSGKGNENHMVLLTGYDTTKDGVHFFEYQNTWGEKWGGDGGYGKFARKISLPKGRQSLIKAYMYPELLDEVFDVRG
ncbi:PREDICTED: probable cysteine protease RDL3 [Camelina sativa]|uniref:Probable cysteine protease RDL3 n=1 Tax=Camelina sativa TaxID=90675 RepID=A0ABM0YWJ2_CAMSA|nr:PREDICTED: probable cysteine protease RDL3 [Camelina sativa]